MLKHPIRDFARRLFAREDIDLGEASDIFDEIHKAPEAKKSSVWTNVDVVSSGVIGAVEGVGQRIFKKDADNVPENSIAVRAQNTRSLNDQFSRMQKKTTSYLSLVGMVEPPNVDAIEQNIESIVAAAKTNKRKVDSGTATKTFPNVDDVADLAKGLVGINKGDDEIQQVRVAMHKRSREYFEVHAFDKKGFHVMWAKCSDAGSGRLAVDSLRASHGRNCDDFELNMGGRSVAGRGNAGLTAEALETIITNAVKHGVHQLVTCPASPQVARLYEKMGFHLDGVDGQFESRPVAWAAEKLPLAEDIDSARRIYTKLSDSDDPPLDMVLDLTDPKAVRQALVAFQLSRSSVSDVPKNISERMVAAGEDAPTPNYDTWQMKTDSYYDNVRVIGDDPPS